MESTKEIYTKGELKELYNLFNEFKELPYVKEIKKMFQIDQKKLSSKMKRIHRISINSLLDYLTIYCADFYLDLYNEGKIPKNKLYKNMNQFLKFKK